MTPATTTARTGPRALAALALALLAVALGACAGAVAPPPPVSGGRGSFSRADDWGFGVRSQTPGFIVDRTGGA